MPIISYIPVDYINGFKEIALMEEGDFKKIEDGLASTGLTSSIVNLAANVGNSQQIHHLPLEEVFSAIGALIEFLDDKEDIAKIALDVVSLMPPKGISEAQFAALEQRLIILLNDQKIYYAYKSRKLITENANNFLSCRIVSDIRPVFDFDIEQQPIAGVITHNLHIHYDSELSGVHKDFFICLDSYDIQVLMESLVRAEKKEETLGKVLKQSGMKNLNV
jgi:hypothetical protein